MAADTSTASDTALLISTASGADYEQGLLGDLSFLLRGLADSLPLIDLLHLGASCNYAYRIATDNANRLAKSEAMLEIYPTKSIAGPLREMPYWAQRKAALSPCDLAHGFSNNWTDETKPVPFAVDSKGPIFVEFKLTAAKAPNGTPTLGLVDAASLSAMDGGLPYDLSRQQGQVKSFAMALSPGSGRVFSSTYPPQLPDSATNPDGSSNILSTGSYVAELNWSHLGDEDAKWNWPIWAGFFLEDGNLTFYRMDHSGHWRSSGIICRDVPERVVPCMFMFSFIGYVQMQMVQVWDTPPDICLGCDAKFQGTKNGWSRWPSV